MKDDEVSETIEINLDELDEDFLKGLFNKAMNRGSEDLEHNLIDEQRHNLITLYVTSLMLLREWHKERDKCKAAGKKGGENSVNIAFALAIYMRKELLDDLGEADWSLIVEEVVRIAPRFGIKDKRTIINSLDEVREMVERFPVDSLPEDNLQKPLL